EKFGLEEQRTNIGEKYFERHKWIPREEVIARLHESSMLLTLGFPDQPGTIPGKVFEYIGTHRNVLVCPSDGGVVHDIITSTNAGLSTSSVEEASLFMLEKFREWQSLGAPVFNGIISNINLYSRESQVSLMGKLIDEYLQKK